ncbi:MAG: rod shape-determining protein MreD [Novosphingobium sp.]
MPPLLPVRKPQGRGGKQINRAHSPLLAQVLPWLSVLAGSLIPGWMVIASAPIAPPLGFLALLGWRQLRPGLLPVWAGLPLGLFDDLFSGQPMGSAVLLWSLAMIVIELVERFRPWRSPALDWLLAAGLIAAYLFLSLLLANAAGGSARLAVLAPGILIAVLVYPLIGRLIAWIDRQRLARFRVIA